MYFIMYIRDARSAPNINVINTVKYIRQQQKQQHQQQLQQQIHVSRSFITNHIFYFDVKSRWRGSSKNILVNNPGQFVLPRTSVVATAEYVEVRFTVRLPCCGKTVEYDYHAAEIMGIELVEAVQKSLYYSAIDAAKLKRHILSVEDQQALRDSLDEQGYVAFMANDAILPRKGAVDDRPMTKEDSPDLIEFRSPKSLEVEMDLPNRGKILGMGLRKGITLIVGGGFHGKSTLLQALQVGV